jgi:hypothetical protein
MMYLLATFISTREKTGWDAPHFTGLQVHAVDGRDNLLLLLPPLLKQRCCSAFCGAQAALTDSSEGLTAGCDPRIPCPEDGEG